MFVDRKLKEKMFLLKNVFSSIFHHKIGLMAPLNMTERCLG